MTDIALVAAKISPLKPEQSIIIPVVTAAAVTAGLAAYQTTSGTFGIADANDSGKEQFRGVFLRAAAAGQVTDLLVWGLVGGYTVSGLNGDAVLYLSNTVGALGDSAGTMTVNCGRVTTLTDNLTGTATKVVLIAADWLRTWS